MKGHASLGAVAQQLHGWRTILRAARVKGKFIALASWIAFLVSAVSEYGSDLDFPMNPALWLAIGICVLLTSTAHAQFTDNAKTNVISGVISNWTGVYFVGNTNFLDVLIIQNGGVLSNSDAGYIGFATSGSNNTAIITGTGSIWSNRLGVTVGYQGVGNSLVISNGGAVYGTQGGLAIGGTFNTSNNVFTVTGTGSVWRSNFDLYVGYQGNRNRMTISDGGAVSNATSYVGNSASVSNIVTVTGSGSVWNNGPMVLGEGTVGNQMIISNGGAVQCDNAIIGNATASSSNFVTVTGAGSVWDTGSGNLQFGHGGPGNQLTISDGGAVQDTVGIVGDAGKNNVVTVTGNGAVWSNRTDFLVGYQSSTNTLTIGPGGSVVARNTYVSFLAGAKGNRINVAGGTMLVASNVTIGNLVCTATGEITVNAGQLLVTNAAANATLEILSGTLTLNGGTIIVDKLMITNACAHFVRTGGTLTYGSAVLASNLDADGDGISNGYEQSHGLDPFNAADANIDSDGDGLSNLQEFLAGTDATNSASAFRVISVATEGNDVRITWMMASGKTNAVQFASGPSFTTNFANLFIVTNTVGSITNYLDVGAFTNLFPRYYRVRLVP
jgi:T5SS/PEP-CTERM-associated repeat protein